MTGATVVSDGAGFAAAVSVGETALDSNARRSASSVSFAKGRPSDSFALRNVSPTLPGNFVSAPCACARALSNQLTDVAPAARRAAVADAASGTYGRRSR